MAGLYALRNTEGEHLKLISLSMAAADARPVTDIHLVTKQSPKSGYHYVTLHPPDEANGRNMSTFAACSYPAEYGVSGKYTYIINEGNTMFKADLGHGRGIDYFPDDDELRKHWEKMD